MQLTVKNRFLPPSCFQELDFAVSCSERSELWPDDQYSSADGTVCHLATLGLCNLLHRAGVQGKVMAICNCSTLAAHEENGLSCKGDEKSVQQLCPQHHSRLWPFSAAVEANAKSLNP